MKRQVMMAGLVMVLAGSAWALNLGDAMPAGDVKMANVDGKEVTLTGSKGAKGTLVVFSCNHCPFAKGWEGRIVALGNEYQKQGVGVVQINSNDPRVAGDTMEAMQKRAKECGFEFPYVMDATSNVARAFGAKVTPDVFLFDAAGKLVYHGTVDDNHQNAEAAKDHYLKDALAALVAGKEIAVKETKPVGCGIKFRPQE